MNNNTFYILFVVAMLLFMFFIKKSGYIEQRKNKLYLCAILFNIITLLCYVGRYFAEAYHIVALSYVINTLIYITGPSISFWLAISVFKKEQFMYKFILGIEAFQVLMAISSPFTHFYFNISEVGIYSRGSCYILSFGVATIHSLIWIAKTLLDFKSVESKDKFRIVLLVVIEGLAVILHAFDGRYKFEYFGASFLLILYYVFMIETDGKYDKMSGAYSRRYYYNVITHLLNANDEYTVMFSDINGLKSVNDSLGHESGDLMITEVADTIKSVTKDIAKVFRIGGDEFLAIVYSTDEADLRNIEDRVNKALEEKSKNYNFDISVAIGFAIHEKGELFEDTEKRADALMYTKKEDYYTKTRKVRRK